MIPSSGKEERASISHVRCGSISTESAFPSSSPDEVAHILQLRFTFDNGSASGVRGIFTYKVNDVGLLTNLRGYWNMEMMKPVHEGDAN